MGKHPKLPCTQNIASSPMLCGNNEAVFARVTEGPYSPCADSTRFAVMTATLRHQAFKDSLNDVFNDRYLQKCLESYKLESFTVKQPMSEFHYTLYYYDQAGNLVKTVPPAGVDTNVFSRPAYFDSVAAARKTQTYYGPSHRLVTSYRYNSLNQVVAQRTPDGGSSTFWYDRLGRLVISQNAKQKAAAASQEGRQYSYTQYDSLGRIKEVGQVSNTTANGEMTTVISRNQSTLNSWLNLNLMNKKEQVTRTFYDAPYPAVNVIPLNARNLRNRVAYTTLTQGNSLSN